MNATTHSPEVWTVDGDTVKGPQADMYPLLFERIHATDADMRLAAAAPRLLAALLVAAIQRGDIYPDGSMEPLYGLRRGPDADAIREAIKAAK